MLRAEKCLKGDGSETGVWRDPYKIIFVASSRGGLLHATSFFNSRCEEPDSRRKVESGIIGELQFNAHPKWWVAHGCQLLQVAFDECWGILLVVLSMVDYGVFGVEEK